MSETETPPDIGLGALFLKFLRFGCLAFGGPVAQIAMVRQALVEEERWVSRARFNRLLAVMQVLPGPEAHELCVHMGMLARGRIGGVLAGLGFMLPGFLLMLLTGWLYESWIAGQPDVARAFLGIQVAVLAVIARAVHRIGRHALEGRLLWGLALGSLAATLLGVPFWLPLVTAGLCYRLTRHRIIAAGVVLLALVAALLLERSALPQALPASGVLMQASTLALFIAGLKGGLLTFGGAYTAIPYVRDDTVGRGWLSDGPFLDGVALAGILPAPLVIFATFAGYLAGGVTGALAITAGMFLPAFGFSLILFERLERIVAHPALHRMLTGVAAAVVGVIAATLIDLGLSTLARVPDVPAAVLLCLTALLIVWRVQGKLVVPGVLLLGGAAGWLMPG